MTELRNQIKLNYRCPHFPPFCLACPRNPKTIRHQCRQPSESDSHGSPGLDPALIYRQVEQTWWQIGACECRVQRRSHFETCGCDQTRLGSELSRRQVSRCHSANGILITYAQRLSLEVAGRNPEHESGVRLLNLEDAKCQPQFKVQSVRKIGTNTMGQVFSVRWNILGRTKIIPIVFNPYKEH